MPHLHLETTANLEENAMVPEILERLVAKFCTFETVHAPSVKAYHTRRTQWVMGEGAPKGFVHLTICLLSGRNQSLRKTMGGALNTILRDAFSASIEKGEAGITLEVREMDSATYIK